MKPEDVPDDLIDLFDKGSYERASAYAGHSQIDNEREYFRGGLAAVIPLIEQQVRAKVAADIQAERVLTNREITALTRIDDPDHVDCGEIYLGYAARIARGPAPAQTTAAHTPGTAAERTDG